MSISAVLSPTPILQFFDNAGNPNAGGTLLTQVGGVDYPTYQDSSGNIPLPNPIPLNSRGEISNAAGASCELFLDTSVTYSFYLYDKNNNLLNQALNVNANVTSQVLSILAGTGGAALIGTSDGLNVQQDIDNLQTDVTALQLAVSSASDFTPTATSPTSMKIQVSAGAIQSPDGSSVVVQNTQTTGTITAPVSNPRIDRVVIDSVTGAISVITGTEAVSPSAPTIPAGTYSCASITLQTSSLVITQGMITDERTIKGPSTAIAVGTKSAFSNLSCSASGSSANVVISASEITVENSSNLYVTLRSQSLTLNTGSTGANGLDTGSLSTSTWYFTYIIYNPTTRASAALCSLSSTSPTLPSGYTYSARIGAFRTDATANKYPLAFKQAGQIVRNVVTASGNVTALPAISSGSQGTWSTSAPVWAAAAVVNYVPSTASSVTIVLTNSYGSGTGAFCAAAPNNNYSGVITTNPPPISCDNNAGYGHGMAEFLLESTNIYFVSNASQNAVLCYGWRDSF